jgi:hypothetical protein
MSPLRRSHVPIASAAELSLWWAEALSEHTASGRTLSLLWLDFSGHRLGRVLSLTDAPPQPERAVVGLVRQLRRTIVAEGPLYLHAHTAIALSRPGTSSIGPDDAAWAGALQTAVGDDGLGTWSFHVAAGDRITTVVHPPAARFHPCRVAWRSPAELLDREWLINQN